jgi:hypothetical protein
MPEQARLRIHGQGKVEVELVTACLGDLRYAYDALTVFMSENGRMRRAAREFSFLPYPFWTPRLGRFAWETPTPERLASFVPRSQQLVLNAVELNSPGFWEFLGSLNPLEVMRKYLNDRHERRKDREYRESAEQRRMALENLALENDVLKERIRIARELGATDSDLAPLLNELVYRPLSALDRYQDKRVIEGAELLKLSDERAD